VNLRGIIVQYFRSYTLLGLLLVTYCFLSNCQGLPGIGLQVHTKKDDCCLGSEVQASLNRSVQTHDELLVTEKRRDSYNCDAGNKGDFEIGENSIEGSYYENRDAVRNNIAKHGFGNAERHVLISLLSSICSIFIIFIVTFFWPFGSFNAYLTSF
jgi:hypothetical protein